MFALLYTFCLCCFAASLLPATVDRPTLLSFSCLLQRWIDNVGFHTLFRTVGIELSEQLRVLKLYFRS